MRRQTTGNWMEVFVKEKDEDQKGVKCIVQRPNCDASKDRKLDGDIDVEEKNMATNQKGNVCKVQRPNCKVSNDRDWIIDVNEKKMTAFKPKGSIVEQV